MRLARFVALTAAAWLLLALPQSASASLSWSGPIAIDSGESLYAVACPSASQCTAVAGAVGEVTFDPASPGTPTPTTIDGGSGFYLLGMACPSTSQCTAVDDGGQQVTFDPASPGTGIFTTTYIGGDGDPTGVACPSTSQCTAVDDEGQQVTFDPNSPGTPTPTTIDGTGLLSGVACPSTGQCTAVDYYGQQVTFDPNSPGTPTPTTIDPITIDGTGLLSGVACPSTSQCTAVTGDYELTGVPGQQVTFDPSAPGTPTPTTIDSTQLSGVACPSTSQCTAIDDDGQAVTFDPTSPGTPTPTPLEDDVANALDALGCNSVALCVAVDSDGNAFVGQGVAPPANVSPPTISGSAVQGETLTEVNGSWTNSPTSFSYQWEDCDSSGNNCSAIAGATSQTYTLSADDVGYTVTVQETASNDGGDSSPASSDATDVVQAEASGGGPSLDAQEAAPNPSENPTTCSVAQPVNCATGTFWHTFTDASVPGLGGAVGFHAHV